MESISKECTPLKQEYDACFTKWYSEKFLQGEKTNDCAELFKQYQTCLKKALKEKGLTKMIADARPAIGSVYKDDLLDADKDKAQQQRESNKP
ncbi:Mitochondrial distribution and morphology protein 35 [Coemansia sp. RSA 1813]|nr:Mitochondrial distribution and morphology protein 35 [Coemansia sp. RSA 1843]KAJ2216329.1 Mitochondrial distribution and morphology protein 35 [Coemansia sp. RSA 487]KAJ2570885.1 Mitochondrial distribution and morphology protein 35 [Coemansia sp. RSA 1813]